MFLYKKKFLLIFFFQSQYSYGNQRRLFSGNLPGMFFLIVTDHVSEMLQFCFSPTSVDNLSSLLSLVDYHRPSFLIHAANSDFDFGSSLTYRDWFKSTSVNQHAFLQQKFLLDKVSSVLHNYHEIVK